jgi:serine/threonine-protein phosphatase 2A catalytic subunit
LNFWSAFGLLCSASGFLSSFAEERSENKYSKMPCAPEADGRHADIEAQFQYVLNTSELSCNDCITLSESVQEVLQAEPNCLSLQSPLTLVGDIHGQFNDLKELISNVGSSPEARYLFLGDFVDRGEHSVRTLCLAWLMKLRSRERVFLLRGNHECRSITQCYGFYDECIMLFGNTLAWSAFMRAFDCLPLTAVIDSGIFCTHAGLSPNLNTIDDINELDRFREIPHDGPMCDLVWSDPWEHEGWSFSYRGAGYQFGQDVSEKFNHENGFKFIARAHHVVMEGYEWHHDGNVVTVFSAPNYGSQVDNTGAVMRIEENLECSFAQSYDWCFTQMKVVSSVSSDSTDSTDLPSVRSMEEQKEQIEEEKEVRSIEEQLPVVHFYGCAAGA